MSVLFTKYLMTIFPELHVARWLSSGEKVAPRKSSLRTHELLFKLKYM